jgi:hypothetical protein
MIIILGVGSNNPRSFFAWRIYIRKPLPQTARTSMS